MAPPDSRSSIPRRGRRARPAGSMTTSRSGRPHTSRPLPATIAASDEDFGFALPVDLGQTAGPRLVVECRGAIDTFAGNGACVRAADPTLDGGGGDGGPGPGLLWRFVDACRGDARSALS